IIDSEVDSKEDRSQTEKGKRAMITNGTLENKAMQMRNRIISVKFFGKR
ncbi:20895_t:CDS:1, partial [Racocetra persica]